MSFWFNEQDDSGRETDDWWYRFIEVVEGSRRSRLDGAGCVMFEMLSEQTRCYGLGSQDDSRSGWRSRLQIDTRTLSALDGI